MKLDDVIIPIFFIIFIMFVLWIKNQRLIIPVLELVLSIVWMLVVFLTYNPILDNYDECFDVTAFFVLISLTLLPLVRIAFEPNLDQLPNHNPTTIRITWAIIVFLIYSFVFRNDKCFYTLVHIAVKSLVILQALRIFVNLLLIHGYRKRFGYTSMLTLLNITEKILQILISLTSVGTVIFFFYSDRKNYLILYIGSAITAIDLSFYSATNGIKTSCNCIINSFN